RRISACRLPGLRLNSRKGRGDHMQQAETGSGDKPLWRQIVDYPLVAMLIAVLLFMITLTLAGSVSIFLVPRIPGLTFEMKLDLVVIVLLLVVYELIIRRLGEHPRDDYRDPHALRHLAIGLGAGLSIFS